MKDTKKTAIKINRMIAHFIEKTMNERKEMAIKKKIGNSLLPKNDLAIKLVEDLDKIYKRKTLKSYGRFFQETKLENFESLLKKYYNKKSDKAFIDFSKQATELFASKLVGTAATGGSIFYIDYIDSSREERLAVFVLSDKERCLLNKDDLSLEENFSLNIDDLNMAVLIKLSEWDKGGDSYLSFAKGLKEITEYFISFIGCRQYHNSSTITSSIVEAVAKYCEDSKMDYKIRRKIETDLYNYFDESLKTQQEVSLTGISAIVNKEDPEIFKNFIADNEFEISDKFQPDRRGIKGWQWKSYSDDLIKLDISKKLIDDGKVLYDDKKKKLIIDDASGNLKRSIIDNEPGNITDQTNN